MTAQAFFARADSAEQRFCQIVSRICSRACIRMILRGVSRLGDGWLWYSIILLLPLAIGVDRLGEGLSASAHMALAGLVALAVYKFLKRKLVRERPFMSFESIHCAMAPLDRYSFPSGHTLHAVLFTTIVIGYAPWISIIVVPFTVLVALSRVGLGLHYPSDVLVGALLGWIIARLSWLFVV